MKKIVLSACLILITISMFGCAAKETPKPTPAQISSLKVVVAELDCRSANQLGCRHRGYIYPWNAWVEMKGYKSTEYEVRDVVQSGNKAVVTVVNR